MTRVLTLPGWQGSDPEHWQSRWERLDATVARVEQADWEAPALGPWLARLHEALAASDTPTVLVAHSLGCLLAVHAAPQAPSVIGALLVAPPDLEASPVPAITGFTPVPRSPLPFPAVVVTSADDPYLGPARAAELAGAWGARLVALGPQGHLNSASGLGTWPAGRALLRELCARAPFTLDPRLARDTHLVAHGPLSELLLMDDARYPWFVLVPRRSAVTELHELDAVDRATLAEESHALSLALAEAFTPDKVNVGALGNVVRQLHLHHVARTLGDPAWPGPVWGHSPRVPSTPVARALRVQRLFAQPGVAARFRPAPDGRLPGAAPAPS